MEAQRVDGSDRPLIMPNELAVGDGLLKVVSTGFLVEEDTALMWRGLMLTKAVEQFLRDVHWGELDDLLIDMPPGTGDVQMGLARLLPRADMVIVTTPALAAQKVAQRAADMARRSFVRVVGVIENMTDFTCDHGEAYALFGAGGGAALADEIGVPLLGQVPLEPAVAAGGDAGRPGRPRRRAARRPARSPPSPPGSTTWCPGRRPATDPTWPAARPACSPPVEVRPRDAPAARPTSVVVVGVAGQRDAHDGRPRRGGAGAGCAAACRRRRRRRAPRRRWRTRRRSAGWRSSAASSPARRASAWARASAGRTHMLSTVSASSCAPSWPSGAAARKNRVSKRRGPSPTGVTQWAT